VLALPGLALLLLGAARARRLWFPFFFLAFAVPIPLDVAQRMHLVLRRVAAVGTEKFLAGIGYDVTRTDTLLRVGPESLQIADACSGFSTLMALAMAALLLAHLARGRAGRAMVFLALVVPLALAANTLRCIALCMLVVAFGDGVLSTFAHDGSGFAAFGLALWALFFFERRLLGRPSGEEQP
jgi:exosortase